jgi:adenylate kinase
MFRAAMERGTPLGRQIKPIYDAGGLVPDEMTIGLIRERLTADDAREGFVLDGFPRNLAQAQALDDLLEELGRPLDVILDFQIDDEIAKQRLLGRARDEGRTDDTPEAIAERLRLYHEQTEPLIQHYLPSGRVVGIHADRPIDQVWSEIQDALQQVLAG